MGHIFCYRVDDGQEDGNPFQAGQVDMAITQLTTLNNIEDN